MPLSATARSGCGAARRGSPYSRGLVTLSSRQAAKLLIAILFTATWRCHGQNLGSILAPLNLDPAQALLVVGDSLAAQAYGFHPTSRRVNVRSLIDDRQPQLQIVWEQAVDVAVFAMPAGARVFTRERWTGAPLVAGLAGSGNGSRQTGFVDRRGARRAGLREVPLSAPGARGPGAETGAGVALVVGLFRLLLPPASRPELSGRAVAARRRGGAAGGGLALLGTRPRARRVAGRSDCGLPPPRHPGLRLGRVPARQRSLLERPSRVAREDRFRPGRATRLAPIDESGRSRVRARRRVRAWKDWQGVSIGMG